MFIYNPSGDVLISNIDPENETYSTISASLLKLGLPVTWVYEFDAPNSSGDIETLNTIDPPNSGNFVELELNDIILMAADIN